MPQWEILPANEIKPGEQLTDLLIWKFAKANKYSIITFDEDFVEIQNLFSFPPKIIWLRTGNINTAEIAEVLSKLENEIVDFIDDETLGIYEIYL